MADETPAPERPAAARNARQRSSDERLRRYNESGYHEAVKRRFWQTCKLRSVLQRAVPEAARIARWQQVQSVWTAWMRAESAVSSPEVQMPEAPKLTEKRPPPAT